MSLRQEVSITSTVSGTLEEIDQKLLRMKQYDYPINKVKIHKRKKSQQSNRVKNSFIET